VTAGAARFHDRHAVIVWAFAALWDAAVVLLGWVVLGEDAGWRGWLALTVFGLAGIGLSVFALKSPLIAVDVRPDVVRITRRHPLWVRRQLLSSGDIRRVITAEEHAADSDPSYILRVELHNGGAVDVLSRTRREAAEAQAARFDAALRRPAGAGSDRRFH
jgi:hypothetical protein